MRLIDADALIKNFFHVEKHDEAYDFFKAVYDAPTIDAVPEVAIQKAWEQGKKDAVRRGEWIFNPKDAIELMFTKPKCSECGFESSDGGNYCPNCGAEMDGGGDAE